MSDSSRGRLLACAVRGPVMLITIGALFALNNFTPYGFGSTWPVLLIVFGLLTLLARGAAPATPEPGPRQPYSPPPYAPAYQPPPPGGYRQSSYTQPPAQPAPAGTVKGGFGTTAPRANDAGQATPPAPGGES